MSKTVQRVLIYTVASAVAIVVAYYYTIDQQADNRPDNGNTLEDAIASLPDGKAESQGLATVADFLQIFSRDDALFKASIAKIEDKWDDGYAVMLLEVARMLKNPYRINRIYKLLSLKMDIEFEEDNDTWFVEIWQKPETTYPDYLIFKSALYAGIDNRFKEYFKSTKPALIRYDEMLWGGVIQDGIPPLKNPEMISASDAEEYADTGCCLWYLSGE